MIHSDRAFQILLCFDIRLLMRYKMLCICKWNGQQQRKGRDTKRRDACGDHRRTALLQLTSAVQLMLISQMSECYSVCPHDFSK